MEWIVVSQDEAAVGRSRRVSLAGVATSLALLAGVAGGAGFLAGRGTAAPAAAATSGLPSAVVETLRRDLAEQRRTLADARLQAEANERLSAQRLAEMNAQLVRLDAAGERMVSLAKLDPKEFDFGEPVAVGGPDDAADAPAPAATPPSGTDAALVVAGALAVVPASSGEPLLAQITRLETQLSDRERQLRVLEDLLLASRVQQDVKPAGWPVVGGFISSLFGYRTDPFTGRSAFHQGIDFAGAYGANVYSVAAGTVSFAGDRSGYGQLIEVNHGNGYVTRYGHNSRIAVRVGDTVRRNQAIGSIGSSGRSTGPHVHFEVLVNGAQVNPAQFVHARR